jgi:hypothetical protein
MPCVYLPGPAPAVTVANSYHFLFIFHVSVRCHGLHALIASFGWWGGWTCEWFRMIFNIIIVEDFLFSAFSRGSLLKKKTCFYCRHVPGCSGHGRACVPLQAVERAEGHDGSHSHGHWSQVRFPAMSFIWCVNVPHFGGKGRGLLAWFRVVEVFNVRFFGFASLSGSVGSVLSRFRTSLGKFSLVQRSRNMLLLA